MRRRLIAAAALIASATGCFDGSGERRLCLRMPAYAPFVTGDTATLEVGPIDADDTSCAEPNHQPYQWRTSDAAIAEINDRGVFRARSPGKVWVTVSQDTMRDSARFVVVPRIASIRIEPRAANVRVGERVMFRIVAVDSAGTQVPDAVVAWFLPGPRADFHAPGEPGPYSVVQFGTEQAVWAREVGNARLIASTRYLADTVSISVEGATPPASAAARRE